MTLDMPEAHRWLAEVRWALADGSFPAFVPGPTGTPIKVGHSGNGYAVLTELALELEVAPGVLVDLDEVRITYPAGRVGGLVFENLRPLLGLPDPEMPAG